MNALEAEGVRASISFGRNLHSAHAYRTLVWLLHFIYYSLPLT